MQLEDIKKVLIVGTGTMGTQIGLQCAIYGYDVTLYDVDEQALQRSQQTLRHYLDQMTKEGTLSAVNANAAPNRITATTDPAAAAAEADLLSESVPEDPMLKGQTLAQFHELCPERTIFTTNTSTLLPSMFASASGRPARVIALHFHLPVWSSNVVDIMPHPGTDPALVPLMKAFAVTINQIPIMLEKEHPAYVFNTMLNALSGAALDLAAGEVASVEDIDRAWMGVMGTPIGPLGILDMVGLDTAWKITDFWARTTDDPRLQRNAAFLKEYVDAGNVGVKSGRGFYSYPHPAFGDPDFLAVNANR